MSRRACGSLSATYADVHMVLVSSMGAMGSGWGRRLASGLRIEYCFLLLQPVGWSTSALWGSRDFVGSSVLDSTLPVSV